MLSPAALALSAILLLSGQGRTGTDSNNGAVVVGAQSLAVGDAICLEGIIMDTFCLVDTGGFLLDNASVRTLENPSEHSYHCLTDVKQCYESGYEVLVDPTAAIAGGSTPEYCRSFKFDTEGTAWVRQVAQSFGAKGYCQTCTNSRSNAPTKGFRATIYGTVQSLGDESTPADIVVTDVKDSFYGCGDFDMTGKLPAISAGCVRRTQEADDGGAAWDDDDGGATTTTTTATTQTAASSSSTAVTGSEGTTVAAATTEGATTTVDAIVPLAFEMSVDLSPKMKMEWGLNLPAGSGGDDGDGGDGAIPEGEETISVRLTSDSEGWIGWAASMDDKMSGSYAIVGVPGVGVKKYFLNGYSPEEMEAEKQTLLNAVVEQPGDGTTIMSFTKLLREEGEIEILPGEEMHYLYAMGPLNTFGYHGSDSRGAVRMVLADGEMSAPPSEPLLGVSVGDEICVEGYIMDSFCIVLGVLFDNRSIQTLEGPDQHSIHCLVDVRQCIETPYEVLLDPLSGDTTHCRAARLTLEDSETVRELARNVGRRGFCSTCSNTADDAPTRGFRATIRGTVTDAGDLKTPPTIELIEVADSSVGCGNDDGDDAERKFGLSVANCVEGFKLPDVAPIATEPGDGEEEGGGGVIQDCATEYQFTTELSDSLRLEFTVFAPDGPTEGTGVFRGRLTYQGIGWVALAVSPDGKMPNSDAVIGIPGDNELPRKYRLGGYELGLINALSDESQTLRNHTIEQTDDGVTIMTFERLLSEPGELPINPDGSNQFIWAVGQGNTLAYHGFSNRGPVTLTLQTCVAGAGAGAIRAGEGPLPDERRWKAHGIMALVGWGFLTPMAIAASWCRGIIGAPLWFKIHMFFNSFTFALSVALFAVAVNTFERSGQRHFQGGLPSSTHLRLGLAMFILVCIQVIGGYARPHLPPPPPAPSSPMSSSDAAETGDVGVEAPMPEVFKKSKVRIVWEYVHKISGEALLFMSMYQIHKGLGVYEDKGYPVFISQRAYWAWIGTFLGLSFLLAVGHKIYTAKKKAQEKKGDEDENVYVMTPDRLTKM